MTTHILDEYIVRLYGRRYNRISQKQEKDKLIRLLFWGDEIKLVDKAQNEDTKVARLDVQFYNYGSGKKEKGFIKKKKSRGLYKPLKFRKRNDNLLKVLFVDVQQGDGTIIELPDGKRILIDGGEGKFIARILAALYPGSSKEKPVKFDSVIVSHGDADHFAGLFEIPKSQNNSRKRKRLFLKTDNIYHNGLVKTGDTSVKTAFGASKKIDGILYATEIWEDPRDAPEQSRTFKKWNDTIENILSPDGSIKRLKFGDGDEFERLNKNGISLQVLGPINEVKNGKNVLRYYRSERGSYSASHTVNGHSVSLRLTYDHVNFFFGGDLNISSAEHCMEHYARQDSAISIKSEILKVPHHGSHEYNLEFLRSISPVVSVVSSGDDKSHKDYVHPRASLLGVLGKVSRTDHPLIFCTELAAFFAYMGVVLPQIKVVRDSGKFEKLHNAFPAFQRLVYGAVRVRTDGRKVLVAIESASHIKEYYLFEVDALGNVNFHDKPSMI